MGDPDQIDGPSIDAHFNREVYVRDQMQGHAITAHIKLTEGVCSLIAEFGAELLLRAGASARCRICHALRGSQNQPGQRNAGSPPAVGAAAATRQRCFNAGLFLIAGEHPATRIARKAVWTTSKSAFSVLAVHHQTALAEGGT